MKRLAAIALASLTLAAFAPQETTQLTRERKREIVNLVLNQLVDKGCWSPPAATKETFTMVTFSVNFTPDGHFKQAPEQVSPPTPFAEGSTSQKFADAARAALETCGALGFDIPPDYFTSGKDERMEFTFLPKIG